MQELVNSGNYDVRLDMDIKLYLNSKVKNGYYSQVQMTKYCRKASLCKCVVWTVDHQVPITLTIKIQGKTLFDNKNTQSVYREIEI